MKTAPYSYYMFSQVTILPYDVVLLTTTTSAYYML